MIPELDAKFEECVSLWHEFVTYHTLYKTKGTKVSARQARKVSTSLGNALKEYRKISLENKDE